MSKQLTVEKIENGFIVTSTTYTETYNYDEAYSAPTTLRVFAGSPSAVGDQVAALLVE